MMRNTKRKRGFALLLDVVFIMTMTALMFAAVTVVVLHTKITSDVTSFDDSVTVAQAGVNATVTAMATGTIPTTDTSANGQKVITSGNIPCDMAGYADRTGLASSVSRPFPGTNGSVKGDIWYSSIRLYDKNPVTDTTATALTCDATTDAIKADSADSAEPFSYALITSVGKSKSGATTTLTAVYKVNTTASTTDVSSLTYVSNKYAIAPTFKQ
jgi:Tfp pilus assembly protein PilX